MRIIAGKYKGRRLQRPPEIITRPTTDKNREALFNILQHSPYVRLQEAVVLDVFAGSGALGLEALSRGALQAIFVESNKSALKILSANIATLQCAEVVAVMPMDIRHLPVAKAAVDLILVDPPYKAGLEEVTLEILRNKGWLHPNSFIVIEGAADNQLFVQPEWLTLVDQRQYGKSAFYFFMLKA